MCYKMPIGKFLPINIFMLTDKKTITKEYYNNRFGNLSQHLNEEELIRWKAISNQLTKLKKNKDIKIADFGCGRGWLSYKLSEFGEVTGFDISELSLENAKKSFSNITFVCLDASKDIPIDYFEEFDVLISSEVIEHIEDQQNYLKNIFKLLKNNGVFIITTPNGTWFTSFYIDGREVWKQPIENWRTSNELVSLINSVGLLKINCTTFQSEWIFSYKPNMNVKWLSQTFIRKFLKALGLYNYCISLLNKKMYGLNILCVGKKLLCN